jgi:hypothetical protein
MKIQCDVCDKEEATVFCPADEAALCDGCDTSIHHANKLASKHTRFSLVHPTFKEFPLCDICQVLIPHLLLTSQYEERDTHTKVIMNKVSL